MFIPWYIRESKSRKIALSSDLLYRSIVGNEIEFHNPPVRKVTYTDCDKQANRTWFDFKVVYERVLFHRVQSIVGLAKTVEDLVKIGGLVETDMDIRSVPSHPILRPINASKYMKSSRWGNSDEMYFITCAIIGKPQLQLPRALRGAHAKQIFSIVQNGYGPNHADPTRKVPNRMGFHAFWCEFRSRGYRVKVARVPKAKKDSSNIDPMSLSAGSSAKRPRDENEEKTTRNIIGKFICSNQDLGGPRNYGDIGRVDSLRNEWRSCYQAIEEKAKQTGRDIQVEVQAVRDYVHCLEHSLVILYRDHVKGSSKSVTSEGKVHTPSSSTVGSAATNQLVDKVALSLSEKSWFPFKVGKFIDPIKIGEGVIMNREIEEAYSVDLQGVSVLELIQAHRTLRGALEHRFKSYVERACIQWPRQKGDHPHEMFYGNKQRSGVKAKDAANKVEEARISMAIYAEIEPFFRVIENEQNPEDGVMDEGGDAFKSYQAFKEILSCAGMYAFCKKVAKRQTNRGGRAHRQKTLVSENVNDLITVPDFALIALVTKYRLSTDSLKGRYWSDDAVSFYHKCCHFISAFWKMTKRDDDVFFRETGEKETQIGFGCV